MSAYNKELLIKVLKDNYSTKTNTDIARILKKEQFKDFGSKSVENIRRRVGEIRLELGLGDPIEQEDEAGKINVTGTGLEIDRSDWMKSQTDTIRLKELLKKEKIQGDIWRRDAEHLRSELDIVMNLQEHKVQKFEIKADKKNPHSEATAVMVGSDWHYEERVDANTVNGVNEFNPTIAKDRISNFFKRGVRLTEIFSKDIAINNIVVALLGDMITGYIHEELVESNYMSPSYAIIEVGDLICAGLDFIMKQTKCNITVPCKIGNHGRTTDKRRISTAHQNSYELIMYDHIASHYKNNDRIQFIIEPGYLTYLNIFEKYPIRFHHGENIKYGGGVGGVTIPATKAISSWDKQQRAYLDVFGHYHTQMLDTGTHKFVLNGSLIGYNPFALSIKAPYEEPQQAFFLIDKDRGKTVAAPIFVK